MTMSERTGTHSESIDGDEQFYAIYYTTEFKFIGRGDAFIAPSDGTYTFKLWGSPGGNIVYEYPDKGGLGGFTEVDVPLKKNQKIYVFVGSAGVNITGMSANGGYNGGGPTITCLVGAHSGSGGGATHLSWSYNPIISDTISTTGSLYFGYGYYLSYTHRWDNIQDVIAVAGGGGGAGYCDYNGGYRNSTGQTLSYGGGNIAGPGTCNYTVYGSRGLVPCANNNTGFGYTHGAGQWCSQSSGGGAGWYGGFSQNYYYPNMPLSSGGGNCCDNGGGGTSYIRSDYVGFTIAGNDSRLLSSQEYIKPATEGTNGYIKVSKK